MATEEMEELKKKISEIHSVILGDFNKAGIISRLTKLEERAANFNKTLIIIGTGVGGLIVNLITNLISK